MSVFNRIIVVFILGIIATNSSFADSLRFDRRASDNRVAWIEFPDGLRVDYHYDVSGFLTSKTFNGHQIETMNRTFSAEESGFNLGVLVNDAPRLLALPRFDEVMQEFVDSLPPRRAIEGLTRVVDAWQKKVLEHFNWDRDAASEGSDRVFQTHTGFTREELIQTSAGVIAKRDFVLETLIDLLESIIVEDYQPYLLSKVEDFVTPLQTTHSSFNSVAKTITQLKHCAPILGDTLKTMMDSNQIMVFNESEKSPLYTYVQQGGVLFTFGNYRRLNINQSLWNAHQRISDERFREVDWNEDLLKSYFSDGDFQPRDLIDTIELYLALMMTHEHGHILQFQMPRQIARLNQEGIVTGLTPYGHQALQDLSELFSDLHYRVTKEPFAKTMSDWLSDHYKKDLESNMEAPPTFYALDALVNCF